MELAIQRVSTRVASGGHDIPKHTIIRRYSSGIKNLFDLYEKVVDYLLIIDNSGGEPVPIAEKWKSGVFIIMEPDK